MVCFTINSFAQQNIELSGYFKENYRSVRLSKQTQRLLFVKMKGNVVIPQWGYYSNLIPADAEKTGLKDILVIATDGEDYVQSDTQLQTIVGVRLSNIDNGIFIDISKKKATDEKLISILKKPSKTDTLNYNSIYNDNDFRLTKQWIDVVDNKDSIIVEGTMVAHLTTGESISSAVYDLTPINKLAKKALHYVGNLFDLGDTDDWTRSKWQSWYEKTINQKTDLEPLKNVSTFTIENNFRHDQRNMALYGKDLSSEKIVAVEALRYNVESFEGHQIIRWDTLNSDKSDYYRPDQKQVFRIDAFKSLGDDLFLIGKSNTWTHLKYDGKTHQYNIQKQRIIQLPESLNVKGENEISLVQMGEKLTYVILKNMISGSFTIVTLNTSSGEILCANKIKELLPMVKEKELNFVYLKYGTEILNGFLFGIRNDKKYHLVKINENLSERKVVETTDMIQNSTVFVHTNTLDVINLNDGFLRRMSFDASLNNKVSEIQTLDFKDKYYDEQGIITFDGTNYQVFFPFSLPLYSGIKMHTLNNQLKPIKSQTVFNFLEVEEPMDENMVHLLFASKLGTHFWLFLKVGADLRYTKIIANTK